MIITSPVVKAQPSEREEIIKICIENHAENGYFTLDLSRVEKAISNILDGNEGVIGVIKNTDIESIMMLRINQFWYTKDFVLEETMNYVRPQYRNSTNAKNMIQFSKRCAEEFGIPLIIGVTSNHRTQEKMTLYERELGEPWGGYFIHNLKNPPIPSGAGYKMPKELRFSLEKELRNWTLPQDLQRDIRRNLRKWSGRP